MAEATTVTATRQETGPVPPRPSAQPDRPAGRGLGRRLRLPLGCAIGLQVVVALGDRLPAVDGLAYFQAGRNLLDGQGYSRFGAPELHFPPLVPVALGLLERATGSEMAALGTWNVLTSTAAVVLLVALAHRLWADATVTVAVAWLAGTTSGLVPLFFRHGSGSEAASLALLLAATLAALAAPSRRPVTDHLAPRTASGATTSSGRTHRTPVRGRLGWLLGCGVLVGLAYLARPEALLPGLLVGAAGAAGAAVREADAAGGERRPPGRPGPRRLAAGGGMFLLGLVVLAAPYVAHLHRHTGSWSLTAKSQDVSIEAWRAVAEGDRRERDAHVYALSPDGTRLDARPRPLTELAAEHPRAWLGIVRTNAGKVLQAYLVPRWHDGPVWALVPAPLVAVGLAELWRGRRRCAAWLLGGIGLLPVATCVAFFTLPRYLVVTTAVLTLFAARGVVRLWRALPRRPAIAMVVAIGAVVAVSSYDVVEPFLPGGRGTADPASHHQAGVWLADHTPPDARVMTRSFHVQAYADRPVVAMPVASYASTLRFARLMGVSYLVADPRSPQYETLASSPRPPGLRLVAVFGRSDRPLRVYALDPVPPRSDHEPVPLGYVGD